VSRNHIVVKKNLKFITLLLLVAFYTIGCSRYNLPQGSKVIIQKEELAKYNPKNFSKGITSKNKFPNEDELIIKAIFLEEQNDFKASHAYYSKLYDVTHQEEYLLKEVTTAHYAGIASKNLEQLKAYSIKNPTNLQAKRLLLSFYLKEKNFRKAKNIAQLLVTQSTQAVDFELAANPYIFTEEYTTALKYLKKAYSKTYNEDILLKIITIQINYLNHIDDAVQILENHRLEQGCSEKICLQLLGIYAQQRKIEKLIPIYKELYRVTKKEIYIEKIIETYLATNKIDSAISYLENGINNDSLLYSLYMEKKSYLKANKLTQKLIKKTLDPKWYAESAISYYESLSNKNDKVKLKKVVNDFEKAIKFGNKNPVYFNYYGYTLIDKDLNLEKGLKIVKKALEQEPENSYFIDSLAWGYYKLNECKKAYTNMKKVIDIEGLNDKEIVKHWNAINNKCKLKR